MVLPVPGGPQRIALPTLSLSISDRNNAPGPSSCSCPTKSSSECGRTRSASGLASSIAVVDLNRFAAGVEDGPPALGVEDGADWDEAEEAFRLLEVGGGATLDVDARAELLLPPVAVLEALSGVAPQFESRWVLMKKLTTALPHIGLYTIMMSWGWLGSRRRHEPVDCGAAQNGVSWTSARSGSAISSPSELDDISRAQEATVDGGVTREQEAQPTAAADVKSAARLDFRQDS